MFVINLNTFEQFYVSIEFNIFKRKNNLNLFWAVDKWKRQLAKWHSERSHAPTVHQNPTATIPVVGRDGFLSTAPQSLPSGPPTPLPVPLSLVSSRPAALPAPPRTRSASAFAQVSLPLAPRGYCFVSPRLDTRAAFSSPRSSPRRKWRVSRDQIRHPAFVEQIRNPLVLVQCARHRICSGAGGVQCGGGSVTGGDNDDETCGQSGVLFGSRSGRTPRHLLLQAV